MAMWRCPHCATPQAEAARCWVCKRSSTSCATCRNFRRSVAPGIGFCGLDRGRRPLDGGEIRPCWDGVPAVPVDGTVRVASGSRSADGSIGPRPRLDFVPVDGAQDPSLIAPAEGSPTGEKTPIDPGGVDRASLWDDLDLGSWPTQPGSR